MNWEALKLHRSWADKVTMEILVCCNKLENQHSFILQAIHVVSITTTPHVECYWEVVWSRL